MATTPTAMKATSQEEKKQVEGQSVPKELVTFRTGQQIPLEMAEKLLQMLLAKAKIAASALDAELAEEAAEMVMDAIETHKKKLKKEQDKDELKTKNEIKTNENEFLIETNPETKTETALIPALPPGITRLIGSYLYDADLEEFSRGAFFSLGACQYDVDTRKVVREKLLRPVFNANPTGVDAFFAQSDAKPFMALIKAGFKEGYDSDKFKKFVLFREWGSLSPLQAAAHTLDIFILIENLLGHIIKDENLLKEGRQQLIEVKQRITDQKLLLDAAIAIYEMEYGESDDIRKAAQNEFNKIQESKEFKAQMEAFSRTMDAMRQQIEAELKLAQDQKSKGEKKASHENKESTYAENAEFLEPLLNLMRAYIYYYIQFPKLNWDQRDKLWEYAGEWHRRLYPYLHQEFFDEKPFYPLPTFKSAPSRGSRHYYDNTPLSLDGLGIGTFCGLYKGGGARCRLRAAERGWSWLRRAGAASRFDLRAIAHLYTLRLTALDNIIENLKTLETATAFVDAYKGAGNAARPKP